MAGKKRVCHLTGFESLIEGGIKTSVDQQRKAMEEAGIEYTESPREDYDVLHINYLDPRSVLNFFTAKLRSKKIIVHSHVTGEDFRESMRFSNIVAPLIDKCCYFFYNHADLVIAPSEYTKRLHKRKGLETGVEVISNGIDTERLEDSGRSREELEEEFETENFTAINLGLVFERKGLTAFNKTAQETPEIEYRWFGPQMNSLLSSRKTSKKMKESPENVRFPGFIDDITEAFRLADVFFFPTKEENQGISLLEAAYKGLPIVVRDIPTYKGWLEHGENCLKADSVEGFKEQLQRLREDDELRERLGRSAREMAENHTLDKIGDQLAETYEKVRVSG